MLGVFVPQGALKWSIFFWQIIRYKGSARKKLQNSLEVFILFSYLAVHQQPDGEGHIQSTFWLDLDGLHVGIGCEGRGVVTWERSSRANASVMVESANRSPEKDIETPAKIRLVLIFFLLCLLAVDVYGHRGTLVS